MSCLHDFTWRGARRAALAGALAVVVAGVGAGCGGGSNDSSNSGGTPATSEDASTLIVAQPEDLQNLDPTLSSGDQVTQEMLTNVYDWLLDYKITDEEGESSGAAKTIVPPQAESM
jgi:ABC-type transport system substrate-binding protein